MAVTFVYNQASGDAPGKALVVSSANVAVANTDLSTGANDTVTAFNITNVKWVGTGWVIYRGSTKVLDLSAAAYGDLNLSASAMKITANNNQSLAANTASANATIFIELEKIKAY
jgi:hypothetical protein